MILSDGMMIFEMTGDDLVILIGGEVVSLSDDMVILIGDGVHAPPNGVWCDHVVGGEDLHFESDIVRCLVHAAVHARVLFEIFLVVGLDPFYRIDPYLQRTIHPCIHSNLCESFVC